MTSEACSQSLVGDLRVRRALLAHELRAAGQDALLFTREGNVTFLCGYVTATWSNFSRPVVGVLRADSELVLIVAETEVDAARERVPDAVVRGYVELRRVDLSSSLPDGRVQFVPHCIDVLNQVLRAWKATRLAVDGLGAAFPPIAQLTDALPTGKYTLRDASSMLWRHRLVKSAVEVAQLRRSCQVLARAFTSLEHELLPGLTEREIHAALAAQVFRAGADALGYMNVVAGVDRGLFGAPTDRVWRPGDVLYVDGGAIVDGYWADFCRMYVASGASETQARGYGRAVRGLEAAHKSFRGGMTAGELATIVASAVELPPNTVGFGRFGHGIGLYMPEPPSLHPVDDTPLTDGFVLCVEPAVEHDGANYVVEEQCVITQGRLEPLSPPAPRVLIPIE